MQPPQFSGRDHRRGTDDSQPELVAGTEANSKITLALIGCGGRGNWIADLFVEHGGYQFVATADYFPDRAKRRSHTARRSRRKASAACPPTSGRWTPSRTPWSSRARRIFIPSRPPAGVDAGCHVYCTKPIAVDVPGCLDRSPRPAERRRENKRVMLVDFQTRTNEFYREAVRRVHAGDIGPVVSGEAVYYTGGGGCGARPEGPRGAAPPLGPWIAPFPATSSPSRTSTPWTWPPGSSASPAAGLRGCGKKGRSDPGNCNDHFAVIYTFPGDCS